MPARPAPLAACLMLAASLACGPPESEPQRDIIHVSRVEPGTVLPGTLLRFEGSGFLPGETVTATFSGRYAGRETEAEHELAYASESELLLRVERHLFPSADEAEGTFSGRITLRVERDGALLEAEISTSLFFTESLPPYPGSVSPEVLSFMEPLVIEGEGFLLPGEGASRIVLDGLFREEGGTERNIQGLELPARAVSRERLEAPWSPALLGLVIGGLEGTVTVVNEHAGPGGSLSSRGLPLELVILRPAIGSFLPPAARRGQALDLLGRGFLPQVAELAQDTLFHFDGLFEEQGGGTVDWRGDRSLMIEGSFEEPGRVRHVLRPALDGRGGLEGLGHSPGVFSGRVTPVLRHLGSSMEGAAWEGDLEILPTLQVVYLKYVPTFSEALRHFGLRNVESEVRARILEVCRRDYADYNVDFRDRRPTGIVDYSVIELAGRDPNDLGLFGLDNTDGFDDGNLRLDDVIGGHNAESEEQGHFSYGGVFLESFLAFSPMLGKGHLPPEFRSSRFDHVFGYFIPDLGGSPVQADEYPGGVRHHEIAEAIRVIGNLVGTTVVHEIGHSLGMVSIPGQYHHDGTSPGLIMNPGQARSFEERAELDGQGPGVWHEIDRDYLESILPRSDDW